MKLSKSRLAPLQAIGKAFCPFLLILWGTVAASAATFGSSVFTTATPPSDFSCPSSPPAAATSITTATPTVWLYAIVNSLQTGDSISTQWLDPTSKSYQTTPFGTVSSAGNYCIWDSLAIASKAPASLPGTWTVKILVNGTVLKTLTLTIASIKTVINQVDTSKCPQVTLTATVTDASGAPISGLTSANFTLKEDGAVRPITVTQIGGTGGGNALSVALIIDRSYSTDASLSGIEDAAVSFIDLLPANTAVAIYAIMTQPTLIQDFTTNKSLLDSQVRGLPQLGAGASPILDTVALATQALALRAGRRAVVLLTDGDDNASGQYQTAVGQPPTKVTQLANTNSVVIYTVGFGDTAPGVRADAKQILQNLATATNGTYNEATDTFYLLAVLSGLGQQLAVNQVQYQITYTSASGTAAHTIDLVATSGGLSSPDVTQQVAACMTCAYSLDASAATFPAAGGGGSVAVTCASGCPWTAVSNVSWITVTSGSGPGAGTAGYTVAPNNTTTLRTGTVTIAGLTYTVTQFGNCTPAVSPTSAGVAGSGGVLTLNVTGASCGWTAISNTAWLTPLAPSGTSATVGISVAVNSTGAQRIGTVTVSGQTVTITQGANTGLQIPSIGSLNPFQGIGSSATLTFVYGHPNGWAALQTVEFIINPRWEANTRGGGCYIKYAPGSGLFTLIADDGNSIAGSAAPGSATSLSNSQCTLNTGSSSVSGNGNNLTVIASLTFKPTFTGQKHIWVQAGDYSNYSTNWLVYGVWFPTTVNVNAAPWYRVYDPFSNTYLYSFDVNEYNTLGARGFLLQGMSGLVMDSPSTISGVSNIAWYRVFVNATKSHLWTSDRNEFLTLINAQQAYVGEGVAAFVMPYLNPQGQVSPQVTNTIPFYRAAYQGQNLHFWTADADEFFGRNGKHLPAGYVGEGIASYIFPSSGAKFTGSPAAPAAADDGSPVVVSAANEAIAPGQVLSIYGRHLGGRVLWNGTPAEVISARDNEIQVVVPRELAAASEATLEVEHRGRRSSPVTLSVVPANPAIFGTDQYGKGHAQARNQDGAPNGPEHPAARGSVVTLYTTGLGSMDQPVEAHIGGHPAEVILTQMSATRAGVIEVQVRVPETLEAASFHPVVLHTGNQFSQPGVGLAIR